jgi:hypothetical protein
MSPLYWEINWTHVEKAIHLTKNASASEIDGCSYELWKKLKDDYDKALKKNKPSFNIVCTLTEIF